MAFAREIFIQIKNVIRFQQSEKEADSHYTVLGNTLVRVSNHCTYMYVWENYFNIHPKQRGMKILSLVFEDNKDTFHPNCLVTQHNNQKPIVVEEYVYPLHGNAQYLSKVDVNAIINSLQNLQRTNRFNEPTGKAQRYVRKSINPTTQNITTDTNGISSFSSEFGYGDDAVSESKNNESKNTKNMKKNTIKLNENQLRNIVAESVKKVLKEDYDFNADFEDGGSVYDRWGEPTEEEAFREIVLTRLCNALDAEATRIIDDYEYEWKEGEKVVNKIWLDTYGDGAPGLHYEG